MEQQPGHTSRGRGTRGGISSFLTVCRLCKESVINWARKAGPLLTAPTQTGFCSSEWEFT